MFVSSGNGNKIIRFINNDSLVDVVVPDSNGDNNSPSISCIGKKAFKDERIIETISITADTNDFTIEESAFENCPALRSVNIKSENRLDLNIQARAFKNCRELSDIVIKINNESKVIIETGAFEGCCNLRTLYIALGKVEVEIRGGAFEGVDKSKFALVVKGANCESAEQYARENGIEYIHC